MLNNKDRRMDREKVVHIHNGHYSALRRNEMMPFATQRQRVSC